MRKPIRSVQDWLDLVSADVDELPGKLALGGYLREPTLALFTENGFARNLMSRELDKFAGDAAPHTEEIRR